MPLFLKHLKQQIFQFNTQYAYFCEKCNKNTISEKKWIKIVLDIRGCIQVLRKNTLQSQK